MTLEEVRQALIRLNEMQWKVSTTDHLRESVDEGGPDRVAVEAMHALNPEHVLPRDVHNAIVDIEEHVPEFDVFVMKERATFVLIPKGASSPTLLQRIERE